MYLYYNSKRNNADNQNRKCKFFNLLNAKVAIIKKPVNWFQFTRFYMMTTLAFNELIITLKWGNNSGMSFFPNFLL